MGFARRTFARLPGGERREFTESMRELIGDMEQELIPGVDAERRPVPPAPQESLAPQRIDPPLAAMNKEAQDPPPNPTDPSTESTAKDPAAQMKAHVRELISDIARLSRSGEDPGRLSDLNRELDDFRLRRIELWLRLSEPESDPAGLHEFAEAVAAAEQPYDLAVLRTDLTGPEFSFLKNWNDKSLKEMRKSLLAKKEAIELRRFPWTHRRRKAT
jgi:hypothetical protein